MATLCAHSITINLTPPLDAWVRQQAKKQGLSMNQFVNLALGQAKQGGFLKGGNDAKQDCAGRDSQR